MNAWIEETYAALLEAAKPPPKPPVKPPAQKLKERHRPTEAVVQDVTNATEALVERMQETMESRRQKRMAQELAEYNAQGSGWHNLVRWRESVERAQELDRALNGEIPENGVYSPVARFEREMRGK
jgi:hypothetical protein